MVYGIKISGLQKQMLSAVTVYIGQILCGYGTTWISGVALKLQDPKESPLPEGLTESQISLAGSVIYIGAIIGPNFIGWFSNVKGRRLSFVFGGLLLLIAFMVLSFAKNITAIYIGRIFQGLGTSILNVMCMVYIGEIASTHIRGILLTGVTIFFALGTILTLSMGAFLSFTSTTYLGIAFAIFYTAIVLTIPESPIFYMLRGRTDAVKTVLNQLGRSNDINNVLMTKNDYENTSFNQDLKELFTIKCNRKAFFIILVANLLAVCSGMYAVLVFITPLLKRAGSIEPTIASIIIGVTQFCGSIITPIFIERSGRKILLSISGAICSISMLLLGVYFYLDNISHSYVESILFLPLILMVLFFLGYEMGLGVIPAIIAGEMFRPNVRSKGSALAISLAFIVGFLLTLAFGSMITQLGPHVTFWIFSATSAITVPYTIFFVPETKGKSLFEIQELLNK